MDHLFRKMLNKIMTANEILQNMKKNGFFVNFKLHKKLIIIIIIKLLLLNYVL